jgi:hypothetical protein
VHTIFKKSGNHLKILGARRAEWNKLRTGGEGHWGVARLLGATIQNLVAMAALPPKFVHFWAKYFSVTEGKLSCFFLHFGTLFFYVILVEAALIYFLLQIIIPLLTTNIKETVSLCNVCESRKPQLL